MNGTINPEATACNNGHMSRGGGGGGGKCAIPGGSTSGCAVGIKEDPVTGGCLGGGGGEGGNHFKEIPCCWIIV